MDATVNFWNFCARALEAKGFRRPRGVSKDLLAEAGGQGPHGK